mgnify:CR=1 FL=1
MTREEAIEELKAIKSVYSNNLFGDAKLMKSEQDALDMAIKAIENIGHLTDRPCDVCEFHKEDGCCKWTCVFTDRLFGDVR